jgi:DNA topoisomerase 2-associated protein PAT1
MSFFGFDSALPRDRGHNARAPGFGQAPDPFAGLSRPDGDDNDADAYVNLQHLRSFLQLTF